MEVQILQTISEKDIASLIITALEGGSNYWYFLRGMEEHLGTDKEWEEAEGYWEILESRLKEGTLKLPVYDIENPDDLLGTMTSESVVKALQTMATDYPVHFNDFITESYDASTADVFFQLAVMDDLVFG